MNAPHALLKSFDGRRTGYLPGADLAIDPGCQLWTAMAETVDPITFEIVRSHLWNINLEHGETIRRASASPTVVYANDFNESIHCANGDPVVFGPSMLHFTGLADLAIKWTLENRSSNPGIRDGDIFAHNDPWIGSCHQQDTSVFTPIFHEGSIFGWVLNVCHIRDLGGVEPGSFVPQAKDVFWEPVPLPPVKLVEQGEIRRDIEETIVRRSRMPELCGLELRSQIAGVLNARERVTQLLSRYGAAVVRHVMDKMIGDCERVVGDRLQQLPDGIWRNVLYFAGTGPEDSSLRRQVLSMRKRGRMLAFENAGTSPQSGQTNMTACAWRAHIAVQVLTKLAHDQYLCGGGVLRCLEFAPTPGLRTSCNWPAAVTGSSNPGWATERQANQLLSQLLACGSPELKRHAWAAAGSHTMVSTHFHGVTASGRRFAGTAPDQLAGSLGGFSFRDGVSSGGSPSAPLSRTADVEIWEQNLPMLFLYRREQTTGGHGKWTGGSSIVAGFIGHRVDWQKANSNTPVTAVPCGPGLFGGLPGPGGGCYSLLDSGVRRLLHKGQIPGDPRELRQEVGDLMLVGPKQTGIRLHDDDVWENRYASASGYGDPLQRELALLGDDVAEGRISARIAERIYGAVMDRTGQIDIEGSGRRRAAMRKERIRSAHCHDSILEQAERGEQSELMHPVGEAMNLVRQRGRHYFACAECERLLARGEENVRSRCLYLEMPLDQIDPDLFVRVDQQLREEVVLRMYLCPGCGVLFDSLVCPPGDGPVRDMEFDLPRR